MKALPDKRTLATAAALACLLPVSWQARGECVPSIVVQRVNDEKFDVTAVEGTSTGECMETEVHKDGDELRSHTTTLPPDGNANSPGQDTTMILNKEVWRLDKKGGGQKDHYGQFGGEWPDDEHTRRLPKPSMPIAFAGVNARNQSFTAIFQRKKGDGLRVIAQMKAYAEKLKARGFTIASKEGEKAGAQGYYSYRAKNGAGYMVEAICGAHSACGLSLFTPETVRKREAKGTGKAR